MSWTSCWVQCRRSLSQLVIRLSPRAMTATVSMLSKKERSAATNKLRYVTLFLTDLINDGRMVRKSHWKSMYQVKPLENLPCSTMHQELLQSKLKRMLSSGPSTGEPSTMLWRTQPSAREKNTRSSSRMWAFLKTWKHMKGQNCQMPSKSSGTMRATTSSLKVNKVMSSTWSWVVRHTQPNLSSQANLPSRSTITRKAITSVRGHFSRMSLEQPTSLHRLNYKLSSLTERVSEDCWVQLTRFWWGTWRIIRSSWNERTWWPDKLRWKYYKKSD